MQRTILSVAAVCLRLVSTYPGHGPPGTGSFNFQSDKVTVPGGLSLVLVLVASKLLALGGVLSLSTCYPKRITGRGSFSAILAASSSSTRVLEP